MHDDASSHVSKFNHEFIGHKRFTWEKRKEWLPSSPDLNPIENQWSVVKMKSYEGGKQYNSKANLSKVIKITLS